MHPPEIFLVSFLHRQWGPLVGALLVFPKAGAWQTSWDIGSIDRDPKLSDDWFCQDHYEQLFARALQTAVDNADLPGFEIPGATSRWGFARGLSRKNALDLAQHLRALWEKILLEWSTRTALRP